MVQEHAHRGDSRILSGLRIDGPVAWHRAALHRVRSLHGDAALCVPHFLKLEKGSSALARRPPLECARDFHHLQRRLLRHADFFRTYGRCADCTTTASESFDAEECSLTLRIYREMLVLKVLGNGFRLLRFDLFGRGL